MLDQESDEALVRAEWGTMNAERNLVDVVPVFVAKIKPARLGKINLVGRDGKLAADRAPRLDINFRPVERGFVWDFDIINAGILEDVSRHHLGLFPKLGFIDKFLPEL